jgi:hypothetical protein
MPESKFIPAQAEELATAFAEEGVDYLFIGKSAAILLGYPDTSQDVDLFCRDLGKTPSEWWQHWRNSDSPSMP